MDKKRFIEKLNSLPKEQQDQITMRLTIEKRQQDLISKSGQATDPNDKQENSESKEIPLRDKINIMILLHKMSCAMKNKMAQAARKGLKNDSH